MNEIDHQMLVTLTAGDVRNIIKEEVNSILHHSDENKNLSQKYLNINEAVNYIRSKGINIQKSTIYQKTCKGQIPFKRYGRSLYFDAELLEEWINDSLRKNPTKEDAIDIISNSIKS